MSLLQSLGLMGIGIVTLLAGAEALVRGAAALALRFGLTPLVVGLTVVAFGTSSPELMVSVQAALEGDGGFAIGNVVGSNVANLALIVGVSAALSPGPVHGSLVRRDLPIMLGATGLLVFFVLNNWLSRAEGFVLTAGIIAYVIFSIRMSRREVRAQQAVALPEEVEEALSDQSKRRLGRDLLLTVGGLALLVVGAGWLLDGAVAVAERLGVPQAVIALTLVALGTSLPELATTVVAAIRGQGEIALGNAIGSNVFNVFGVLGPAALVAPMSRDGVSASALLILLAVSVLTCAFLYTGGKTRRWEGVLLLVVYALYIWWIIPR